MKKLMVAFAAVAVAFCAQAVTVNWAIQGGIQINGDWDSGEGDSASSGWSLYVFDANTVTRASVIEALGAADSVTAFNALSYASLATTKSDGAAMGVADLAVSGGDVSAYVVLLQGNTVADGVLANVSTVYSTASTDPVPTTLNLGAEDGDWINMTSGWTALKSGSSPVPEPTSGLLMLLGVAGLALRRRRA